jgi:hypothetical protein
VEGGLSTGLIFRHADGSLYGRLRSASAVAAYSRAAQALRAMGFRESETRQRWNLCGPSWASTKSRPNR